MTYQAFQRIGIFVGNEDPSSARQGLRILDVHNGGRE